MRCDVAEAWLSHLSPHRDHQLSRKRFSCCNNSQRKFAGARLGLTGYPKPSCWGPLGASKQQLGDKAFLNAFSSSGEIH